MARLKRALAAIIAAAGASGLAAPASAQTGCDLVRSLGAPWRCVDGFTIGPGDVVISLPIAEDDPDALHGAGIAAANRRDWRAAIAYFTAAAQRGHLTPRHMYALGLAHARAGHEVPAIAWLVAYLIAAPDAPNRAAIWREIVAMEHSSRRRTERLWTRLQAAAAAYRGGSNGAPNQVWAMSFLASFAAAAGDIPRMEAFHAASLTADSGGSNHWAYRTPASERAHYTRMAVQAALEDGDLVTAEALRNQLDERNFLIEERDLRGGRWFPRLGRSLIGPRFIHDGLGPCDLYSCDSGPRAELLRHRRNALALADRDHDEAALAVLTVALARHLWLGQSNNGESVLNQHRWTTSAYSDWLQFRFDPPALIAEHHLSQGRIARAIAMVRRAGSYHCLRFVDYAITRRDAGELAALPAQIDLAAIRREALAAAGGGQVHADDRLELIEAAYVFAITLPGAAYDPSAALAVAMREDTPGADLYEAAKVGVVLPRALRRIRAHYRRAGGTWGQ